MADFTFMDWATIAAVLTGPVAGLLITRRLDGFRAKRERKMHVFRSLMRSAKARSRG